MNLRFNTTGLFQVYFPEMRSFAQNFGLSSCIWSISFNFLHRKWSKNEYTVCKNHQKMSHLNFSFVKTDYNQTDMLKNVDVRRENFRIFTVTINETFCSDFQTLCFELQNF